MNAVWTIAKKEINDARKNKLFLILLTMLIVLSVVSILLGTYQVGVQVKDYQASVTLLKSLGKKNFPSMPNLNPISASKNFVNYMGMIGALLAITLGNNAIVKEQRGGTLKLILSRKVFKDLFLNGKLLGNMIILAAITAGCMLITFICTITLGQVSLTASDSARMLLFFLMSFLYMSFFLVLGIAMAVFIGNGNRALLLAVIIWLILSFVLPQIGDTMDMDNQIPGGFFASMGMTRQQETQVLQKFKFYENLRDGIEEMSPVKHYERVSFALLNVKPGFDKNTPMEVMGLKWIDLAGLTAPNIILWLCAYVVFLKRENIYQN